MADIEQTISQSQVQPSPTVAVCPQCHEQVLPTYYFCPNCGKNLKEPPLSTTVATQAWIYVFSIILPCIAYLAIGQWPAMKYIRSADPKTKQIGIIAMALMLITSAILIWYSIVWFEGFISSASNGLVGSGNLGF
jgi:hypothetical protein